MLIIYIKTKIPMGLKKIKNKEKKRLMLKIGLKKKVTLD